MVSVIRELRRLGVPPVAEMLCANAVTALLLSGLPPTSDVWAPRLTDYGIRQGHPRLVLTVIRGSS